MCPASVVPSPRGVLWTRQHFLTAADDPFPPQCVARVPRAPGVTCSGRPEEEIAAWVTTALGLAVPIAEHTTVRVRARKRCASLVLLCDRVAANGDVVGRYAAKCSYRYPDADEGKNEYVNMIRFNSSFPAQHARCPRPVAYDRTRGILLTALEPGVSLGDWIARASGQVVRGRLPLVVRECARWLRRFHALDPQVSTRGLRRQDGDQVAETLASLRQGCADGPRPRMLRASLLDRVQAVDLALFDRLRCSPIVFARRHGDFGHSNVLVDTDARGVTVLDVTRTDFGNPWADVEYFLTTLDLKLLRSPVCWACRRVLREAFLREYTPGCAPEDRLLSLYAQIQALLRVCENRLLCAARLGRGARTGAALVSRLILQRRIDATLARLEDELAFGGARSQDVLAHWGGSTWTTGRPRSVAVATSRSRPSGVS